MNKNYPQHYEHLQELAEKLGTEIPGSMAGFGLLHIKAIAEGALSIKTKELIALGIASPCAATVTSLTTSMMLWRQGPPVRKYAKPSVWRC